MGDGSSIEWTDATWNPVTGCTKVSPGCDHCYAERFAERFRGVAGHPYQYGFDVVLRPERLELPLRWSRPRRIFVTSMGDLFHDQVPLSFVDQVFDTMERAPWHTFQLLTKRPGRLCTYMRGRLARSTRPLDHVWMGVSVESNAQGWRVPVLRRVPAAVRFVSFEPLLGSVNTVPLTGIQWAIAGGESGSRARPMHVQWVRDLRDRCGELGVRFFFKQWGEWTPEHPLLSPAPRGLCAPGSDDELVVYRAGKRRAGRRLDGRTWDEFPVVEAVPCVV